MQVQNRMLLLDRSPMNRKSYPSDLTDAEWKLIEPLLPKPLPRGPKDNVDLREVVISESMIYAAMIRLMLRRLADDRTAS